LVFAPLEAEIPAKSGPAKMHTRPAAETFRVLVGEFEFQIVRNGEPVTLSAGPGTTVHVPGGKSHLFRDELSATESAVKGRSRDGLL